MAIHTHMSEETPKHNVTLRNPPYERILAVVAGLILLAIALYIVTLLQHVSARLDDLPKMTALLSTTNDRLTAVSSHLEQMEAMMNKLPPLLSKVNENVRQISPPLRSMNQNAKDTSPTFRRMDESLTATNKKLTGVEQKFDGLQKSMGRVEESTRRLRKILPR